MKIKNPTPKSSTVAQSFQARQLAKGLTLEPCWIINEDGQRVAGCRWVRRG